MPPSRIRCAIEQIADWHPNLFVEPHVVALVAVATQYSRSPAVFDVSCENVAVRGLGKHANIQLEVSWHDDTREKAERLRSTMQTGPLVELAAVALALVLAKRAVPLGRLDVTAYGSRADYHSRRRKLVLEISGTEVSDELGRRHRAKVAQAGDNPFGWDAYVIVCAFAAAGHRIRFSKHSFPEFRRGEGKS